VLGVLLLLQQAASPPSCTPQALCRLLEQAEAVNTQAMLASGGYRAAVETESAMLGRREGRMEAATLLQQNSGLARWSNDVGFDYHVMGSRSYSGAIPLSRLALLRVGWLVPTLAGTRLQLITQSGTRRTSYAETLRGTLAPAIVVHPLAVDRETFYRYTGGDPVRRSIDHSEREVLAVEVTARTDLASEETLFEGELDLDPQSHAVVRLVGRFRIVGRVRSGGMFRLPDFEPEATLVDLVNQRLPNGSWVPLVQRFEIQTASRHESGSGASRRVISRFYRAEATPPRPGGGGIGASTMGYQVTSAPRDSLHRFHGWAARPGQATEAVLESDFSRFRPDHVRTTGGPLFLIQGYQKRDFVRVNRIEGLFTGLAGMVRMRDAAPGIFVHATGGYAWSEKTVRGSGRIGWESKDWTVEAIGGRTLDVTNKFRNQFDSRALSALVGRDAWDYVDRYEGGVSVTRSLESQGSVFKLEAGRVRDAQVSRHLSSGLIGGGLRPNRNVAEGSYWRGRATLDWNPEVSPLFAHDGVGFRAEVEQGSGDLDYTRVEGRVVMRKNLTKLFFIARLHAGAVFSNQPPPQQLFELGGPAGLPGYEYKEFAGDRAALFRMRLTYPLAVLDLPWRVNSRVTLPALAPAISLGFQGGFTDTRNAGGTAAVRALGDRYDYKTGEVVRDPVTGDPLPASLVTVQLRTSVDLRVGFFGDALAVGVARALEQGRKIRFIFAFGRQF
jgi:hypothetical protein